MSMPGCIGTSPFQVSYFYLHSLSHGELSLYILDFHFQKDSCIHLQFETLCAADPNLIWIGEWVYRELAEAAERCAEHWKSV